MSEYVQRYEIVQQLTRIADALERAYPKESDKKQLINEAIKSSPSLEHVEKLKKIISEATIDTEHD